MQMVRPGSKDRKASILITGPELHELQRLVWMMAESFGLDRRIANYQGMRPIEKARKPPSGAPGLLELDLQRTSKRFDVQLGA